MVTLNRSKEGLIEGELINKPKRRKKKLKHSKVLRKRNQGWAGQNGA